MLKQGCSPKMIVLNLHPHNSLVKFDIFCTFEGFCAKPDGSNPQQKRQYNMNLLTRPLSGARTRRKS
jgi:hypothetical protein